MYHLVADKWCRCELGIELCYAIESILLWKSCLGSTPEWKFWNFIDRKKVRYFTWKLVLYICWLFLYCFILSLRIERKSCQLEQYIAVCKSNDWQKSLCVKNLMYPNNALLLLLLLLLFQNVYIIISCNHKFVFKICDLCDNHK